MDTVIYVFALLILTIQVGVILWVTVHAAMRAAAYIAAARRRKS